MLIGVFSSVNPSRDVRTEPCPNITGTITEGNRNLAFRTTGCFLCADNIDYWAPSADRDGLLLKFNAALGNPIYDKSSTVQPAALQTLIIIKI